MQRPQDLSILANLLIANAWFLDIQLHLVDVDGCEADNTLMGNTFGKIFCESAL